MDDSGKIQAFCLCNNNHHKIYNRMNHVHYDDVYTFTIDYHHFLKKD